MARTGRPDRQQGGELLQVCLARGKSPAGGRLLWSELLNILKNYFFSPDFGSAHWFGGPEELVQRFPLSKTAQRQRVPYLPGDMLQVAFLPIEKWRRFILQNPELYLGGVAEPFWLNSLGAAVWVGEQVFVGR